MPLFSFEGLTPQVHAGAFVAPTATLVGDVIVEEGASIWYGAVIRADYAPVIVRRGANVQDNAVIHGAARPHDRHRRGRDRRPQLCRARRDARSRVPGRERQRRPRRRDHRRGCLVAAGSVVAAGTKVPPGMLFAGSPAVIEASGQGHRRRGLGRDESRGLRRARPAPPHRHPLRRPHHRRRRLRLTNPPKTLPSDGRKTGSWSRKRCQLMAGKPVHGVGNAAN